MMHDLAYRVAMQARHPTVARFGYLLQTKTIQRADNFLKNWVELGKSGLAFSAPSRMGKTYAIRQLRASVQEQFAHVVCVSVSAETQSRTDRFERTYTTLLQQLNKDDSHRQRSKSCDVFANHLLSLCRDASAVHCVVFLDEAQKFSELQWNALYIALNRLERNDCGMLVYSFGNEELRNRGELFMQSGRQGIEGRFFVKLVDFDGVRTREELQVLMKQYDESLYFPDPLWPFTRYFAQSAYDSGWRLERETGAFWSALCEYAGVPETPSLRGFRMQWITDPIHFVLKDCLMTARQAYDAQPDWAVAIEQTCPMKIV